MKLVFLGGVAAGTAAGIKDELPAGLDWEILDDPIDRARLTSVVRAYAGAANGRVLVVDDNPDDREAVTRTLADSGYDVVDTASGAEALAWLEKNPPPALMLLDLIMPGIDGWTVLAAVKGDPELLRAQVERTVRHEIAHHLGWDERGVRDLGL